MSDERQVPRLEALKKGAGSAPWSMLEAHAKRDGLILVSPELDLMEVAVAVADDQGDKVAAWMSADQLTKPDAAAIARFEEDTERQWPFVIVAPFVLVTRDA